MKKAIFVLALAGLAGVARADYTEGFEAFTGTGWNFSNQSNPIGPQGWGIAGIGHTGTSSLADNYQAGSGTSTLSSWAELPVQVLNNGDTFSFWTQAPFSNSFPDRLQLRMSTNGASSNTGTTEFDVGDFSTLLLDINPN
jgi:hypothetical protein